MANDNNETTNNTSAKECICAEDMANIGKLREMVKDDLTPFYDTNFNLLRWLRGFDNNFEEIVPKLRNHLAMRKSALQLDNLTDEELHNHPLFVHHDTMLTSEAVLTPNCLVCVERSGQIDFVGMMQTHPFNECIRARILNIERMLRAVMEKERQTGRQHWIMGINDLAGIKFDRRMFSMAKSAIRTDFVNEHYVELFHSVIIVNTPNFFFTIWAVIKPLVPERTLRKIRIFGHSGWHDAVLKVARPEALPAYWNENEEEKRFMAKVKDYLPVDPCNYYTPKEDGDRQQYSTLLIRPGKRGVVELQAKMNQKLRWKFETDGHFAFGVYVYHPRNDSDEKENAKNDREKRMAYPMLNLPGPTLVPIVDSMPPCEAPGEYHFVFSNEHAWMHSLKIRYRIWAE